MKKQEKECHEAEEPRTEKRHCDFLSLCVCIRRDRNVYSVRGAAVFA